MSGALASVNHNHSLQGSCEFCTGVYNSSKERSGYLGSGMQSGAFRDHLPKLAATWLGQSALQLRVGYQ